MAEKVAITTPKFKDFDIIRSPSMTEKSNLLLEKVNAYTFIVDKTAKKQEIKGAIERVFKVKVLSVNTINSQGKTKVFRGRIGKRADFKKAIVKLAENNKIDLGV
ncbi:MAG: 50S ribosomal protein L23 [Holosporales bacterium]|jgi:large subunit ribosomal protein L23|nr:50S ribosomal protein L23 [Holosporales bacterium]